MDYFKNKAAEWDSPIKIEMAEKFIAELLKNQIPTRDNKILDYGCGTGLVGMELSKITRDVVYLDSSESMIEILKKIMLYYQQMIHYQIIKMLKLIVEIHIFLDNKMMMTLKN